MLAEEQVHGYTGLVKPTIKNLRKVAETASPKELQEISDLNAFYRAGIYALSERMGIPRQDLTEILDESKALDDFIERRKS